MILLVLIATASPVQKDKNDFYRILEVMPRAIMDQAAGLPTPNGCFVMDYLLCQTTTSWRRFLGELFFISGIQDEPVSRANGLIQAETVPDHQGLNRNIQALRNP